MYILHYRLGSTICVPKSRSLDGHPINSINSGTYRKEKRLSKMQMKKTMSDSSEDSKGGEEPKSGDEGKDMAEENKLEKDIRFEPIGYESHLVETIEKDILQRDTAIRLVQILIYF